MFSRSVAVLLTIVAGCNHNAAPPPSDGGSSGGGSWVAGASGALVAGDDGLHFQSRPSPLATTVFSLFCVEGNRIWAAGSGGAIAATTDRGEHWQAQPTGASATLRGIAFANRYLGVAAGEGGTLLRSADGGEHWAHVSASGVARADLWSVTLRSSVVLVSGAQGTMLRSLDGGATFGAVAVGTAATITAVRLSDDGHHATAVTADGAVFISANDGLGWQNAYRGGAELRGVAVASGGARILAVGARGTILRSNDFGQTWRSLGEESDVAFNAVSFSADADVAWIAGERGAIVRAEGDALSVLQSPTTADLMTVEEM